MAKLILEGLRCEFRAFDIFGLVITNKTSLKDMKLSFDKVTITMEDEQ